MQCRKESEKAVCFFVGRGNRKYLSEQWEWSLTRRINARTPRDVRPVARRSVSPSEKCVAKPCEVPSITDASESKDESHMLAHFSSSDSSREMAVKPRFLPSSDANAERRVFLIQPRFVHMTRCFRSPSKSDTGSTRALIDQSMVRSFVRSFVH